jgi:tetratricopeptide (TPR) repeat protein
MLALIPGLCCGSIDLERGWREGAQLFFNDAAEIFSQSSHEANAAGREARLGRAVMLLGVQPRTAANIEEANALLETLRRDQPDDEPGIAACYYMARLEQVHRERPDLDKARGYYAALVRQHPRHFFAQLARLKLAMLALYDTGRTGTLDQRMPEAREWGGGISDPVVLCDYHYMMSRALARIDGREAERLEHLLAMEDTGQVIRTPTRSLMLVEIGEMARAVGRRELAVRAYRQFATDYPRDPRLATILKRLAELGGQP